MDSVKQLIIRACKSRNPEKRLRTLYRRFYLTQVDDKTDFFIAGILSSICDTHLNVTVAQMVSDFFPKTAWKQGIDDEDNYWASAVKILTGYIRLAENSCFPGLTPPAMFREKPGSKKEVTLHTVRIEDEDEVWQVVGALDEYKDDGMGSENKRPEFVNKVAGGFDGSIAPYDMRALDDLSDRLFYERTGDGLLEFSRKSDFATILAALYYVKHKSGFHGEDWKFEPNGEIIRTLIARLEPVLKSSNQEVA